MRRYPFGKYILNIPAEHKIGEFHYQDALYDRAYGFILEEISRRYPQAVFVDVGANIGDTAAFFATYVDNPVVCVEGAPEFLEFLRLNVRRIGEQVRVVEAFLRPEALAAAPLEYRSSATTGNLNVVDGAESTGLDPSSFISVAELRERCLEVASGIGLVKTDTDGWDVFLVQEFLRTMPECPLFFECDVVHSALNGGELWPEVFGQLQSLGYSVLVFDNFGLPVASTASEPSNLLSNLSNYVRLQHEMGRVHLYYLDVWAFPEVERALFDAVIERGQREFFLPL